MKKYSQDYLRIAFFISRSTKLTREWFRGTMLYTRHNPKWFVRIFELGNGHDEELLAFWWGLRSRPSASSSCASS